MKGLSYVDIALNLVLLHLLCTTRFLCSASSVTRPKDRMLAFRVDLKRRDDENSLTERLQSAVERSKIRVQNIATLMRHESVHPATSIESPVRVGDGEFLMKVGMGTPAVFFDAIVDTGSDLIWTQCQPCKKCFNQSTPIFNPSKSPTYSTIPCSNPLCKALAGAQDNCSPDCGYYYSYVDSTYTSGDLSYETMTIGSGTSAPHMAFGCAHESQGEGFDDSGGFGGLVGLGRGALSLISQLGDKVDNKFSYCLLPITEAPSKTSSMFFGAAADLSGRGIQTIPFIKSEIYPPLYFLPVRGITVGGSALHIPEGSFHIEGVGGGGAMVIDSGCTVTYLPRAVYDLLMEAVQSAVKLSPVNGSSVGFDLCYKTRSTSELDAARVTFKFKGGVDYELPTENTFVDAGNGLLCLAVAASSATLPSVFGNIQQQNFHILYDNAANMLSFMPAKCDSL